MTLLQTELVNNNSLILSTFRFYKTFLRLLSLIFIIIWCAGFLYPVLFPSPNFSLTQFFLYETFSNVCHQHFEKSLTISGIQMLVCTRCAGIYSGALITATILLTVSSSYKSIKLFLFALLLMLLDVVFTNLYIYTYIKPVSFATGLFVGSTGYIIILNQLENFLLERFTQSHNEQ